MKYVNGLYTTLVLMMFIILVNTTILNDQYSGIAMFMALGVFIVGSAFYVHRKQLNRRNDRK